MEELWIIDRRGCRLHFAEGRTKAVGTKGTRVLNIRMRR